MRESDPNSRAKAGVMIQDPRSELTVDERRRYLEHALELADVCRAAIKEALASGIEVRLKSDGSLVTNADMRAERAFREAARSRLPDAGVLGEEFGEEKAAGALQWIVDPIDGTAEFAKSMPLYSTIIALRYKGMPVVGVIDQPALDLRCHAAFGLGAYQDGRRLHIEQTTKGTERIAVPSRVSFLRHGDDGRVFDEITRVTPDFRVFHTAYAHVCALIGAVDAAVEWRVRIWDLAATQLLIEEAGGVYRSIEEPEEQGGLPVYSAVFGKRRLVERLAEILSPPMSAQAAM